METVTLEEFQKIQIYAGTVISVNLNEKARNPAWILEIDFGKDLGVKTTSAQLTELYSPENLLGTQLVAVLNFPSIRVAGVKSGVMVESSARGGKGFIQRLPFSGLIVPQFHP